MVTKAIFRLKKCVYLCTDALDNRATDDKFMFLCRVLLGQQCQLNKAHEDLVREPCLECNKLCCLSHAKFYNSVVGTSSDGRTPLLFREFVVYDGEKCYPEYLIRYKQI